MGKDLNKYRGIIPAFYACYDDEGNVSKERTMALAKFYRDKGVKGLYVNGSSGEGFLLTIDERKLILEAVMEAVGTSLTIIVHVAAMSTKDSVELAKHAENLGVDAISAVPNIYYRVPERSIERFWTDIIDSANLDFIIYNIPQTTGYNLSKTLFEKMIQNPKVIGVKNSSMATADIQLFKSIAGDNFLVFNGPDEQYISGRIIGADAGIGGTYGVMPELFLKAEEHFTNGNYELAKKVQYAINDVIYELLSFPNLYGAAKEILRLRGINIGTTRLPLEPVPEAELERIIELYQKLMINIECYCS